MTGMADRIPADTMPRWGMVMTEGKLAGWLVEEGQPVAPGTEVVEIETTKITNVMDTPASGVLRRKVVAAGETVPVGALLGVVAEAGIAESEIDAFVAEHLARIAVEQAESIAPSARLVAAGGGQINVLTVGAGEALPILLIHGFGGDLNSWLFNLEALAAERTVHAIDLPSHGGSPMSDLSGGVPAIAKTILSALDSLGVSRAHLVGHSLGGALAIWIAKTAPERVASLSLLAPGGIGPEISTEFLEGFARAEKRKEMKAVLGLLFADAGQVSRDMVDNALKYKRLDGAPEALKTLLGAILRDGKQRGGLREALTALPQPTQIIWGAEDRVIPATQLEGLPASIAVHRLPGVGHMPMMEAAAEVNRLIAEHIRRAETRP
jgi:pyruvate dehydrogenase E2 component (dihydrolipoamide acetyltransferase)